MKLSLDKLAGRGGFSRVYVARVTSSAVVATLTAGARVAVKKMHITKHAYNSVLRHEACAYILLAGHRSIPEVYAWGRSQYYDYLALELLGEDVLTVREGLTLRNFVVIACDMFDVLEHVHSRGLVHCDVKPGNFLFGPAPSHRLKVIDFGLAAPFRDLNTNTHFPERSTGHLRGTPRYASISTHLHRAPGRRDDMESLAYTLVHLACGRLPWAHCFEARDILLRKSAWRTTALPPVLAELVAYTRALAFAVEPDYARWRTAFLKLVPGLQDDDLFDPADAGPRVAEWAVQTDDDDFKNWDGVSDSLPDQPPSLESDSDSIPDSDDGWVPTSVWPAPLSVQVSDLIGDERATVRDQLQHIEEPPAMAKPWLIQFDSPETMMVP